MLDQTKRAIDNLLEVGLNRKDFRVRTRKNSHGEYKTTQVTLFVNAVDKALLLAQYFETDVYLLKSGQLSVSVKVGKPSFNFIDFQSDIKVFKNDAYNYRWEKMTRGQALAENNLYLSIFGKEPMK